MPIGKWDAFFKGILDYLKKIRIHRNNPDSITVNSATIIFKPGEDLLYTSVILFFTH